MSILDQIVADKRVEIAARREAMSESSLRASARPGPAFVDSLCRGTMGLIAEVKHRSPSAGVIRSPFDPAAIARCYERAGAQAVSVLMDESYFGGGEDHFRAVREAVFLPLLYKEFVVDPWQVAHAASLGASAVLLIVGVLDEAELRRYSADIRDLGMQPLVEVHDEWEMEVALRIGADLIGVNNRNLKDFTVSLQTTADLARMVDGKAMLVSESGIHTPEDVARVRRAGAGAVLVGESLLRQPDLERAVETLMGAVWASS